MAASRRWPMRVQVLGPQGRRPAVAAKAKVQKTNAMRELERAGVPFEVFTYEPEEGEPARDLGLRIAALIGADPASQFKTLVCVNEHQDHVVCCIPVSDELDLKKVARAAGAKSLEMMPIRDLEQVCGYARGAVSPVGMKHAFPTFVDETAQLFDTIGISGGRKGICLMVEPDRLVDFLGATLGDLVR